MKSFLLFFITSISFCFAQNSKKVDSVSNMPLTYLQANLKTAIPILERNAEDANKIGNTKAEAKTYALLALAMYFHGDYDQNIFYLTKAINLFEKIGDWENVSKEYSELGYRLKATNIVDSEKYLLKAMKIAENKNFSTPLLSIYNQYGEVKSLKKQEDSAMIYYKKGLSIKEKVNDSVGIPYSLVNIGYSYTKSKKFGLAKKYFDRAMSYRIALKDHYGISDTYAYYGDMYFEMKKYNHAIDNYKKSLNIATNYEITNLIRHNLNMISQAYEAQNDYQNALSYYKKSQTIKDSIINKETYDKMSELQIKFDTFSKENQILQQQAIEKKRNNTIKILIIIIAFLLLTAFLINRQLNLRNLNQKKEFELKTAFEKIESQNKLSEQRQSISRDLHDNIGSQLTLIISSIDNLKNIPKIDQTILSKKLSSISNFTRETITELRDTIWAMNYDNVNFEEIHLRVLNFISKAQYSYENINFTFNIEEQLQSRKLSSNEGLNIFRIIQEAINNAVKHSNAKNIDISITTSKNQIIFSINDDGKGFNPNEINFGNGLRNMERRAKDIAENFDIYSEKGSGTTINFSIKKL